MLDEEETTTTTPKSAWVLLMHRLGVSGLPVKESVGQGGASSKGALAEGVGSPTIASAACNLGLQVECNGTATAASPKSYLTAYRQSSPDEGSTVRRSPSAKGAFGDHMDPRFAFVSLFFGHAWHACRNLALAAASDLGLPSVGKPSGAPCSPAAKAVQFCSLWYLFHAIAPFSCRWSPSLSWIPTKRAAWAPTPTLSLLVRRRSRTWGRRSCHKAGVPWVCAGSGEVAVARKTWLRRLSSMTLQRLRRVLLGHETLASRRIEPRVPQLLAPRLARTCIITCQANPALDRCTARAQAALDLKASVHPLRPRHTSVPEVPLIIDDDDAAETEACAPASGRESWIFACRRPELLRG